MKRAIEMPEVEQCEVSRCAYNVGSTCHARAITVGNMDKHLCDTMIMVKEHTQRKEAAGVGACRSANCVYNEDLECQADGINVTVSGGQAVCKTFAVR
jgi:hypothetical protein